MNTEFIAYDVKYNFDYQANKDIKCLDWFLPLFRNGSWEPETFEIFNYVKCSNKAAVDVGAWIGPTSIWLSNNFKYVISIEPDIVAFNALEKNLQNSGCSNVKTINRPCYSEEIDVVFGTNEYNKNFEAEGLGSSTSQIKKLKNNIDDRIQKAITLQHLKSYDFFNDISFVKVDIEGGEENILNDLFEYAKAYKWKLYISFHCNWWKRKDIYSYRELFNTANKRIVNLTEKNGVSVDSLLSHIAQNPSCSVYFEFV